ncbi:MAG: radical SAM protein, partial [Candidatus Omnitrophica bacterium]|nr:radical SAM protein [Candidatus Omnitrophota bacterium]
DSFRISLNSTEEKFYNIYFNPVGYKFKDVLKSIEIAKRYKKFVSINLFVFPGFIDSERQINSLIKFIDEYKIDMIQWRNLNIDPDFYLKKIADKKSDSKGLLFLINKMKQEFPAVKMGYFNITKESF